MKSAPIVLFVYNRPWHTQKTVEALQKNELAKESNLYIYSDAPGDESEKSKVAEVRRYIHRITSFKNIHITERGTNWGLAANIINGVTEIVNKYGKLIVLEDDLVTSPYFLKFMNGALDFYQDIEDVWHISGWNYPIKTDGLDDTFLWRLMNCWGWATWSDKWQYFEKDTDKVLSKFSKNEIKYFNLDGYIPYWNQLIANSQGKINTWAVYWYIIIFKSNGLCLNPKEPLLKNIGLDNTGIHTKKDKLLLKQKVTEKCSFNYQELVEENAQAVRKVKEFHNKKRNLFRRVLRKLI